MIAPKLNAQTITDPTIAVPVVGFIVSVNGAVPLPGGGTGYFTNNTSYTIMASIPESGPVTLEKQVPQIRLWSARSEILIDADELVGKAVTGVMVAGSIRWNFYEPPKLAPCSAPSPAAVTIRLPDGTIVTRQQQGGGIDLPPIDGGTSDLPSNPPNAPGGGEE